MTSLDKMTPYERLVITTQKNYERYYGVYAQGGTPYELTDKTPAPYEEQIERFAAMVEDADCILVGGASGLSAAGGGDFYYGDSPSFRKYFGKFASAYNFVGAFNGMHVHYPSTEARWGFLATFLHTTQTAPLRAPYRDLDTILKGRDFFVLTTNQDTQFTRLYPPEKLAEIQGDHRFFQCERCCTDDVWDAVGPVDEMIDAMGNGLEVPTELVPRCPHCGGEAFPWVRGYFNFLQGEFYQEQYRKVSDWLETHNDAHILFMELGVGRLTPMFIQEPFWQLTAQLPQASYVSVNFEYAYLPKNIEDRGLVIKDDIAKVLADVREVLQHEATTMEA